MYEEEAKEPTNTEPEVDEFVKGLIEDGPAVEETAPVEVEAPVVPKEKEEVVTEAKPEEVKPEVKPEAPKMYKFRGREYSVEQLEQLGLLEDALTGAQQAPHYQGLYEQTRRELDDLKAGAVRQGEPAPAQQPPISPQRILQHYSPVAQEVVKAGYIEPEAFEMFPQLTTNLLLYRDLIDDVRMAVAGMLEREDKRGKVETETSVVSLLDNLSDSVAADGEYFTLLKDPQVRNGFYEYLRKLDPYVASIDRDFIKKQWMAYNADAIFEANRRSVEEHKEEVDEKRRNAGGESPTPRPAAIKKDKSTHLDIILEDFPIGG